LSPGPDISVDPKEEIDLAESCDVLAIVFDFMYPRRQEDIEKMEFEIVAQVAEAVEKYQVFSALKVCEMRLKYVAHYCGSQYTQRLITSPF